MSAASAKGVSAKSLLAQPSPSRRCVVCGKSANKKELLRFVMGEEGIVFDSQQVMPGRGAYLTKEARCVFAASVVSLLNASITRTRLERKAKRKNEKDLITKILQDWSGLKGLLEEKPKPGIRL